VLVDMSVVNVMAAYDYKTP